MLALDCSKSQTNDTEPTHAQGEHKKAPADPEPSHCATTVQTTDMLKTDKQI